MAESDLRAREMELEYRSFLDDEATDGVYHDKVMKMIKNEQTRLLVKINDTRKNPNFKARAVGLIENSAEEIVAFQRALKEYVISIDPQYGRKHLDFFIGLCGSFGSRHVTPRTLNARFLNNTVCVEGIVSKISIVKPKLVRAHHYCEVTKKQVERRHYDLASLEYQPSTNTLDAKDENGNPLVLEPAESKYKDHQTLTLQEMPEVAPAGQLPRTVDVILENDLIDNCKPGDRVQIVGTYRSLPNKQGNFTTCQFRTVVIANHVEQLSKEVAMTISADDIKAIQKESRSRRYDIFERLAKSLAPSIYGHESVKKAILCLLLGGVEKHLANGSRLRGDINVLLIGDPSVAKSQLLRFVIGCAPRAIPTTGRGSSGVGLTAAVTMDPETGDRRLEAGAMVLADRGVVCVDEFDKMSDIDRTAIHEVMEQGRVSICKAGIQARLNARCSVLAAANPVCGNYDPYKLPMINIGMQDSLLSRFDLLFIMLDQHNRENDKRIAEHVLRVHRYRPQDQLDGEATEINVNANFLTTMMDEDEGNQATEIYEKRNPIIQGRNRNDKIFTLDFLRKYIHIAKKVKPQLTEEACLMIGAHYWNLREIDPTVKDLAKTQPITPRSLETLIRLSTAHAKARLDTKVTSEDAAAAIELIQLSCYHKVLSKARVRTSKRPKSTEGTDDDESGPEDESSRDGAPQARNKRARVIDGDSAAEPADEQMDTEERIEPVSHLTDEQKETIKSKLPDFMELINDISRKQHGAQTLDMDLIYVEAEKSLSINKMETDILILLMQEKDMAILDSNHIYLLA